MIRKLFIIILSILLITVILPNVLSEKISNNSSGQFLEKLDEGINSIKKEFRDGNIKEKLNNKITASNKFFSFYFFTNYDGIKKQTRLKLLGETKIDINNDTEKDIAVRFRIYPGIEHRLGFCLNFKITSRSLDGFNSLNKRSYFENYLESYYMGILIKNLSDSRLRFGYESIEGEKIPERSEIVYKYIPHILSLRKKPEHKFIIDTEETNENTKLNLIFSFHNNNKNTEVISKIKYSPIVDSEITFKRDREDGTSIFKYIRSTDENTVVDIYIKNVKEDSTICSYGIDIPEEISISLDFGRKGLIKFDTYGSQVKEFGICDSIKNPKNKVFFKDIFTEAAIEWNKELFFLLRKGKFNASVYTKGEGVSLNIHLEGDSGGEANFSFIPDSNIIDASLEIDLSKGHLILNRNEFDIFVSFSISILNKSISKYLSTIDGSFNIVHIIDSPFKILFDNLFDGDFDISLYGGGYEISSLTITGFLEKIGGNFSIIMDRLYKEKSGFIRFILSVNRKENNVTGACRFEIDRGAEIENLSLTFNKFEFHRETIKTSHSIVKYYPFSISVSIVDWHVAKDLSSGYILIGSNSSVIISFDSKYSNETGIVGLVSGNIKLKTTNEVFNISWETIDGNLSFNLDGKGLVELSDFYLWIKNKAEISIPEISLNFQLDTYGKQGRLLLYLDKNVFSGNINIENINITNLFNLTIKGSILAELDAYASGSIDINWNKSGISSIGGDFNAGATGKINITNFNFYYKGLINVSARHLLIDGGLNVNFIGLNNNISILADVDFTNIIISDLNIQSSISSPLAVSADMDINFNGSGFIDIIYSTEKIILDGAIYDDSDITINTLWFLVPGIGIEINLESLKIKDSTTIVFSADTSKDILFSAYFYTDSEVTADTIYLGYPGVLQIFVYDFVGGGTGGNLGMGLNTATGKPVIDLNHSTCFIGNIQVLLGSGGSPISLQNLFLDGTARLEAFVDIALFSYVYLKGEIYEKTTVELKDMNVPVFGNCNISIVIEKGNLDLLFQNDLSGNDGGIYVYGYSSSWINVNIEEKNLVKLSGILDLWVHIHQSSDGTFSAVIDAKEASGAIIIAESLRIAGELDAYIEFSVNINKTETTTTFSDFFVNISGDVSAFVQIKVNNTDWIPIIPFSTTGQVILFKQSTNLMSPPNIIDDFVVTIPNDQTNLTFEVWYAPPFGKDNTNIGPFNYNLSYGDGTYYEEITNDNRIVTDSHLYSLGEFDVSVTVTTADSSINAVEDDLSFEIIKKITYLEIIDNGPLTFTYDDVGNDGRIHTWFKVANKAEEEEEEDYNLEWKAGVEPFDVEDTTAMDIVIDPLKGILDPGENVRVNVSFFPPADHKDHNSIYLYADNINYTGYGEDGASVIASIKQSFSLYPSNIYLPRLNPGESIKSSIWVHNNKKESLNWRITDYPNYDYDFSKISGNIPANGAGIIHFTVTAPNEDGIDLGGEIKIIDVDDPINTANSIVNLNTINSENNSNNSNVTITEEENGNVSIAIGGSNEIHINNFQFVLNNIIGEINGHFTFDTNNSYVYINWTKSNFSSFSVEGSADFTVNNFRFAYGDNISIEVSKVITGGINWRKGRSGRFTVNVDDTFKNVNIDVSFNCDEYSNFTLSGNFDIDIKGESTGTIWFDWNFKSGFSSDNLTIGGDLFGYNNININITDFEIRINKFYLYTQKIFFNKTIDFSINETGLHIESESTFEIGDIYFEFEFDGGYWEIFSINNAEFVLDGSISFNFYAEDELFCVTLQGYFEIHATVIGNLDDMDFEVNLNIVMEGFWKVCGGAI